jgi:hypothetical protein
LTYINPDALTSALTPLLRKGKDVTVGMRATFGAIAGAAAFANEIVKHAATGGSPIGKLMGGAVFAAAASEGAKLWAIAASEDGLLNSAGSKKAKEVDPEGGHGLRQQFAGPSKTRHIGMERQFARFGGRTTMRDAASLLQLGTGIGVMAALAPVLQQHPNEPESWRNTAVRASVSAVATGVILFSLLGMIAQHYGINDLERKVKNPLPGGPAPHVAVPQIAVQEDPAAEVAPRSRRGSTTSSV